MKKKLFGAGLAAAVALSCPAAVMAGTIQSVDGTESHDVKATYAAIAEAKTVYAVEITWGSMVFTYTAPTVTKTWNPTTHTYQETKAEKGTWTNEKDANKVSVTNRSNKALTATISAETTKDDNYDYTGIKATPEQETLELADASVGADTQTAGKASTEETMISLEGELTNKDANQTPIGNVTVTIKDAEEVQP